MTRKACILAVIFLISGVTAQASSCGALVEEMRAMKKAQQAILRSLAENHGSFGTQLNEVATEAEMANGKLPNTVIQSLRGSAKAYKKRQSTAHRQADQLDSATEALIADAQSCLKSH